MIYFMEPIIIRTLEQSEGDLRQEIRKILQDQSMQLFLGGF